MSKPIEDVRTYLVANVRVDPDTSCWIWQRYISSGGYGRIKLADGRRPPVHRASYEVFVGPFPDELVIDHLCRNPPCINPGHLEPVTAVENFRRGAGPGAALYEWPTHCKNGHEMTEDNYALRTTPQGKVGRRCLACHKQHGLARQERLRSQRLA